MPLFVSDNTHAIGFLTRQLLTTSHSQCTVNKPDGDLEGSTHIPRVQLRLHVYSRTHLRRGVGHVQLELHERLEQLNRVRDFLLPGLGTGSRGLQIWAVRV